MGAFIEKNVQLIAEYKFALLCREENCVEFEEKIHSSFAALAESCITETQKFANEHRTVIQQAFEWGKQGITKDSGNFQQLLEQVKSLNDTVLVQAFLSSHDKGISEYEPKIDWSNLAEDIIGNSFKGSTPQTSGKQAAQEIESLLEKISKYRSWTSDPGKQRELKEACERIRELDPAKAAKVQKQFETGKEIAKLHSKAYEYGLQNNKVAFDEIRKKIWKLGATEQEVGKLYMQFSKGKKKKKLFRQTPQKNAKALAPQFPIPYFDPQTAHPFYIGNLPEEEHWRIFIDETGDIFSRSAFDPGIKKKQRGKFAALFVPDKTNLPALGSHHATAETTEKNQKVLADLLNKGNNCGILGVTLDGMAQLDLDYWHAGFEHIFDITLRLLPIEEKEVTLEFYIENRGAIEDLEKTTAMLRRTADTSLLHFGKSFPKKANLVTIKIHCIAKTQTEDRLFLAYNGYVDTIACAWNGGRKELYDMLRKGGLIHRCLLDGDIQEFPEIMDRLAKNTFLTIAQWNDLLRSPDTAVVDSPVNALLAQMGFILRQNVDLWLFYVDAVLTHLDSKAIRLTHLAKQINYLTANMPPENNLPLRLKIIWLTAKLAEENHHGNIAKHLTGQLEKILKDMYLEDAPLCCWSILHQAVTYTNEFCFANAQKLIQQFCKEFDLLPDNLRYAQLFPDDKTFAPEFTAKVAVVGLRYYGQILSSLGQHEAFCGNHEQANEYFLCAIKCFSLLSDGALSDISQTMSYWITNCMDHIQDPLAMMPHIENYLDNNLEKAAEYMGRRKDAADKYRHHIMLRYFQRLPQDHPAVQKYLSVCNDWQVDNGHPWEMIEFYRAMLTQDAAQRTKHLTRAAEIAAAEGPTLHIIATAIYGSWYYFDKSVKEQFENIARQTVEELPDLGAERVAAIQEQLKKPQLPLEFIRKLLPFNFR